MLRGDIETTAALFMSSEGESICINMGKLARKIGSKIRQSEDLRELWILLDAIDSGLSIDNVNDFKDFFKQTVLPDAPENTYILISANAYEMCRNERCMDVRTGETTQFPTYEAYRDHILRSREKKDADS